MIAAPAAPSGRRCANRTNGPAPARQDQVAGLLGIYLKGIVYVHHWYRIRGSSQA